MRTLWAPGRWQASGDSGQFGIVSPNTQEYVREDVSLTVYFRYAPSPAMRWHVEWLLRLATEFYLVKYQTHELQRMGYLQAVYETGARVTHDVKNLLQSLQTLCYAAAQPGDPAAVAQLLARQLPQIAERLKSTLDKLQRPQIEVSSGISATEWWARLQDRHAGNGIEWHGDLRVTAELPGALFDSVAENLLQNALAKRQNENGIEISVNLTVDHAPKEALLGCEKLDLAVRDTGQAIPPAIEILPAAPVALTPGASITALMREVQAVAGPGGKGT